jgi:hypothetical protein
VSRTVGDWLATIEPPPPALAARLRELLGGHLDRPSSEVPEACLDVGERQLAALLESGSTTRGGALDLLAIDALVTYAFEAAADEPASFEDRAVEAMVRISRIPDRQRP